MIVPTEDGLDVPLGLWAVLLYEARRGRRMTQPQLARASGVAQQTISKLEQGMLCPHDRLKLKLAAALDVNPSLLFPWPTLAELAHLRDHPFAIERKQGSSGQDGPPGGSDADGHR